MTDPQNPVLDESNPLVRATQAPFDAGMGQFHRDINDAQAAYQETVAELDKKIAEREEGLRARQPKPAEESTPDWDYDNPLPDTPARPRPAPTRRPSTPDWDYENPLSDNAPRHRPPPTRLTRRPVEDADEEPDSWLR
jgi:hypothetical protein